MDVDRVMSVRCKSNYLFLVSPGMMIDKISTPRTIIYEITMYIYLPNWLIVNALYQPCYFTDVSFCILKLIRMNIHLN